MSQDVPSPPGKSLQVFDECLVLGSWIEVDGLAVRKKRPAMTGMPNLKPRIIGPTMTNPSIHGDDKMWLETKGF
jgi:hypothetical protein